MLNTELATWGYPLALNDDPDFSSKTLDLSDEEYNKQVQSELERLESDLDHDQRAGKAYKEYVSANMQINALVLQGARTKMQGIVNSPYDKYGYDYVTYLVSGTGYGGNVRFVGRYKKGKKYLSECC